VNQHRIASAFGLPPEYFSGNLYEDAAELAEPDESGQGLVQYLLMLTPTFTAPTSGPYCIC
jgi:hypothetical protein